MSAVRGVGGGRFTTQKASASYYEIKGKEDPTSIHGFFFCEWSIDIFAGNRKDNRKERRMVAWKLGRWIGSGIRGVGGASEVISFERFYHSTM